MIRLIDICIFLIALGFFIKQGVIDIDIIGEFFGAYIIEVNEYNELRDM
jgi:hypothetical protein